MQRDRVNRPGGRLLARSLADPGRMRTALASRPTSPIDLAVAAHRSAAHHCGVAGDPVVAMAATSMVKLISRLLERPIVLPVLRNGQRALTSHRRPVIQRADTKLTVGITAFELGGWLWA